MMTLPALIQSVGYLGITAIAFAENGLLIGFFLPGDSLLFTAGFLAAQGFFNFWILVVLLLFAAITGVSVGYAFGYRFGRGLFHRPNSRFFKQENLAKAEEFYKHHGAKTIVLARFIPVVRTFAPIVAGIGRMPYGKFLVYNIVGGCIWVITLTGGGFLLGERVHDVDRYLLPVIAVIILLSVAPGIYHMLRQPERRRSVLNFFRRRKN